MVRDLSLNLLVVGLLGISCVKPPGPQPQEPGGEPPEQQATTKEASAAELGGCDDGLFSDTDKRGSAGLEDDGTIVRRRFVTVDFDRLSADDAGGVPDRLTLNLFDDLCVVAVRAGEAVAAGPPTWSGRVDGVSPSRVTLVGGDGSLMGTIDLAGALYQIRDLGEGVHALLEIDPSQFPEEEQPLSPPGTE